MPVEFTGMIGTHEESEILLAKGPAVNPAYTAAFANVHEQAGFDRILIGYASVYPDGLQVAGFVAQKTSNIKILVAHRPGFIEPTLAARSFATLDHFSGGRVNVHIISGMNDAEQQRDGDFLTHDQRYARTDDYLDVLKKSWTSEGPFDHDGPFYKVRGNPAAIKPLQSHIPIFFGGMSQAALRVGSKHADVYALWGEPVEDVRQTIIDVRAAAAAAGRAGKISFSLSVRPILAPTEAEAWARADRILERARGLIEGRIYSWGKSTPENVGSQRLLAAAAAGKVRDQRLWTEIATLLNAGGNSTALVGTPEQVAESLLAYHDVGVTNFLIRGFNPLEDAADYGRELLPLVRAEVARRENGQAFAAAE